MEALEAIFTRKSVRQFIDKPIEKEKLDLILQAAMSGPSAVNARPYELIVVDDKEILTKMANVNGRAAFMLPSAALGILICGNLDLAYPGAKDYYAVDCSIVGQNICLAAHALGLGAVWLGTWPQENKVNGQKELFSLPENVIPHSIIALGYPKDEVNNEVRNLTEEKKIHKNMY